MEAAYARAEQLLCYTWTACLVMTLGMPAHGAAAAILRLYSLLCMLGLARRQFELGLAEPAAAYYWSMPEASLCLGMQDFQHEATGCLEMQLLLTAMPLVAESLGETVPCTNGHTVTARLCQARNGTAVSSTTCSPAGRVGPRTRRRADCSLRGARREDLHCRCELSASKITRRCSTTLKHSEASPQQVGSCWTSGVGDLHEQVAVSEVALFDITHAPRSQKCLACRARVEEGFDHRVRDSVAHQL